MSAAAPVNVTTAMAGPVAWGVNVAGFGVAVIELTVGSVTKTNSVATFEVANGTGLPESGFDFVSTFDVVHDSVDPVGLMTGIRRALKPDGLFLGSLLGGQTLVELRAAMLAAEAEVEGGASPRVAPFADLRDIGALLQRAGFALPVTDVDRVTVRYASPLALMHDLRRMGATNALTERRRTPLRRGTLRRVLEIYAERFADPDGRIRATFEIVWLSGWAPHESQQQPLKPGSAKTRLADALGAQELSTGEKAGS